MARREAEGNRSVCVSFLSQSLLLCPTLLSPCSHVCATCLAQHVRWNVDALGHPKELLHNWERRICPSPGYLKRILAYSASSELRNEDTRYRIPCAHAAITVHPQQGLVKMPCVVTLHHSLAATVWRATGFFRRVSDARRRSLSGKGAGTERRPRVPRQSCRTV